MAYLTLEDLQREFQQFAADTLPAALESVVSKDALIHKCADIVAQHVDQHMQKYHLVPSAYGFVSSPSAAIANVQSSGFATPPSPTLIAREDPLGLPETKKLCAQGDMVNQPAGTVSRQNPEGKKSANWIAMDSGNTNIDMGNKVAVTLSSTSYIPRNQSSDFTTESVFINQWFSHHPTMHVAGERTIQAIQALKYGKNKQSFHHSSFSSLMNATVAMCTCVTGSIEHFVKSGMIDYASAGFILLNAVSLGVQTDYLATNVTHKVPEVLRCIEIFFCIVFATELVLRLIVYRIRFLYMSGWKWNLFDIFVVGLQVAEEMVGLVADTVADTSNDKSQVSQFRAMRVLRVLRLVRVIRLVRILHLIGDLQTLIASIVSSVGSLKWTFMLLLLLIYILSIYITQAVLDYRLEDASGDDAESGGSDMMFYFGSLGSSVLTLYQAISGGVEWRHLSTPLVDNISPLMGIVLSAYIGFAVLALFNIATGVFVDSAQNSARQERQIMLLRNVRQLFEKTDQDQDGRISLHEFKSKFDTADMQIYFKHIGLGIDEAEGLFALIDIHGSGAISPEDFINGCLRLSGTARSFDLAIMMHGQRQMTTLLSKSLRHFDSVLQQLHAPVVSSSRRQALSDSANLPSASADSVESGVLKPRSNSKQPSRPSPRDLLVQPSRSSMGERQRPKLSKPSG